MRVLIAAEDAVFGDEIVKFVLNHNWPDNVEFKVMHAVEPIYLGYHCDSAIDEKRFEWAQALVARLASKLKTNMSKAKVKGVVVNGPANQAILDMARYWQCDLIVVGSHGRRGLSELFLGSVSMAVLSKASCSVVVVRMAKGAECASSDSGNPLISTKCY